MIKRILKEYQKPDLIVASSVVTHLKNPIQFSKNIKQFIKKNGTLIIEIEYLQNPNHLHANPNQIQKI